MKYLIKVTIVDEIKSYEVMHSTNSKSLPRGGKFIFVESELELFSPVVQVNGDELTLIEDPSKVIESQISVVYDSMVKDIYDEMLVVFGTRNDVSASAFAATFEAMLKRPENYVDVALGLVDETAVTAYASAKILTSDAYGVFRMKRIAQFEAERQAIIDA